MVVDVRDFELQHQRLVDDYCDYLINVRDVARKKPPICLNFPEDQNYTNDFFLSIYKSYPDIYRDITPVKCEVYAESDELITLLLKKVFNPKLTPDEQYVSKRNEQHNSVFTRYTPMNYYLILNPIEMTLTKITSKRFKLQNNEALAIFQVMSGDPDISVSLDEYYYIYKIN